jgi:hypothetical protein
MEEIMHGEETPRWNHGLTDGTAPDSELRHLSWLTPINLADRWQIPTRTLGQWRYEGRGPAYVKIGGAVRYRLTDVEAYEDEHMVGIR